MKDEIKVIACLALLLLALETGARLFETRLSKDVAHLRELPQEAAKLRSAPANALKVLVLGNSLARCGIDLTELSSGLQRLINRKVTIAVMHPDSSRIEEWAYGYQHYFAGTDATPDVILMITGRLHLVDGLKDYTRMGAFYVGRNDLQKFITKHLHRFDDGAHFFAARYSALFTHRDRIEPLVFYNTIPGYEFTAEAINRGMPDVIHSLANSPTQTTCHMFEDFVSQAKASGTQLILAQAPLPDTYQLPKNVMKTALAGQIPIIMPDSTLQINDSHFPDKYHLDQKGSIVFTRYLLNKWPILPPKNHN